MIWNQLLLILKGKNSVGTKSTGPVGRLSTEGLSEFFEIYQQELGTSTADKLKDIHEVHLEHDNPRWCYFTANALFWTYGLVILDADNQDLKRNFIPYVKKNYYIKHRTKRLWKQRNN
jgi:hypothetical protein